MIKKILLGFGGVVAVAVLLPVSLVLLNKNPFGLVERLPLVHSFTVEGDVRMTDGESLPEDKVTVRVTKVDGRTVKAKATAKNGFAYTATFMGFTPPVGKDDKFTVRADMPAVLTLLTQTDALEGEKVLLADYPARAASASSAPESDRIMLTDRKLRLSNGEPAIDVAGWGAVLLARLRNFPDLQIDEEMTIVLRSQESEDIAGDPAFQLQFPEGLTVETARALRLSELGGEIAREPFVWDKKRPSVGFNYEMAQRAFRSVHIRDVDGVNIRSERLAKPNKAGPQTWVWDGKDDSGEYAPAPPTGQEYTFVAFADSFDLSEDPTKMGGFRAEILASAGPRVRYAEVNVDTTVGEFIDTFGLSLVTTSRGGVESLGLKEATLLHTARLVGDPEDTEAVLRGDSTVDDLVTAFGVVLDQLARSSKHVAAFDVVIRGAEYRTRLDFVQLRSETSVATRDEFLDLPLAAIEAKQRQGFVSLAGDLDANGPLTVVVTRRLGVQDMEDWESGRMEEFSFTMTGTDTLRGFLAQLNKLNQVNAKLQGSVTDEFEYDVLVAAPEGRQFTFFLAPDKTPNKLRINVRAAGVMASLTGDPSTVPGDALTAVGVEAIVIGLDGSESADDALLVSVIEGAVVDGGAMPYVDGAYRGQYTAVETTEDATDTLVVTASTLQARNATVRADDGDEGGTLYKAVLNVDVLGVEPPPVVTAPAEVDGSEAGADGAAPGALGGAGDAAAQGAGAAPTGPVADPRKMSKLYANLTPASAAELILAMPADQARPILLSMQERDASKIIDAILTGDVGETAANLGAAERLQSIMAILGTSGEQMVTSTSSP